MGPQRWRWRCEDGEVGGSDSRVPHVDALGLRTGATHSPPGDWTRRRAADVLLGWEASPPVLVSTCCHFSDRCARGREGQESQRRCHRPRPEHSWAPPAPSLCTWHCWGPALWTPRQLRQGVCLLDGCQPRNAQQPALLLFLKAVPVAARGTPCAPSAEHTVGAPYMRSRGGAP